MKFFSAWIVSITLGVTVIWVSDLFGLWWITLLVGISIGIIIRPGVISLTSAILVGTAGWGLLLTYLMDSTSVNQVASVAAAFAGLGIRKGYIITFSTVMLGMLLCLSGAWVGLVLRQVNSLIVSRYLGPGDRVRKTCTSR